MSLHQLHFAFCSEINIAKWETKKLRGQERYIYIIIRKSKVKRYI